MRDGSETSLNERIFPTTRSVCVPLTALYHLTLMLPEGMTGTIFITSKLEH